MGWGLPTGGRVLVLIPPVYFLLTGALGLICSTCFIHAGGVPQGAVFIPSLCYHCMAENNCEGLPLLFTSIMANRGVAFHPIMRLIWVPKLTIRLALHTFHMLHRSGVKATIYKHWLIQPVGLVLPSGGHVVTNQHQRSMLLSGLEQV